MYITTFYSIRYNSDHQVKEEEMGEQVACKVQKGKKPLGRHKL
jgi:hypothetical protein